MVVRLSVLITWTEDWRNRQLVLERISEAMLITKYLHIMKVEGSQDIYFVNTIIELRVVKLNSITPRRLNFHRIYI